MSRALAPSVIFLALASISCGGSEPVAPQRQATTPGLHVVAGADVTDTVDAMPSTALSVHVVGADGQPAPGVVVRFVPTIRATPGQYPVTQTTMLLARLASPSWTPFAADTTDQHGNVAVLVRMGSIAGPGSVVVTAPALGFTDTATFTIQPGAATHIVVAPADTAVYVGTTVTVRAHAIDRYQNTRSDPVTLSASRPIATLQGAAVTATDIGRARITATIGTWSDTMGISVVPHGTVVAQSVMDNTGVDLALYTVDLDGSNLRKLVRSVVAGTGYFGELPPAWSPDGKSVYYHDNKFDHTRELWVVDVASGVARHLTSGSATLPHEAWPAVSHDGQWVYYDGSDYAGTTLFRVDPSGTTRQQVGPIGIAGPSVAPDNQRVAAIGATSFYKSATGPIVIFNVNTQALTTLTINAQAVAWSPVDDRIAYLGPSGDLRVVNADGTGDKALAPDVGFSDRISWSPDGKYVIGHRGRWFGLVDIATGQVLPINLPALPVGLTDPSWKP